MIVNKGQLIKVTHVRKGVFEAVAAKDFDTEKEEWYPVVVVFGETIEGLSRAWEYGTRIPCRRSLCKIEVVGDQRFRKLRAIVKNDASN